LLLSLGTVAVWWRVACLRRETTDAQRQLARLQSWIETAAAVEPAVSDVAREIEARWSRMFPAERRREELFLDLARVADLSGVEAFDLEEEATGRAAGGDDGAPPPAAPPPGTETGDKPWRIPADAGLEVSAPTVVLEPYRIKASFRGDYAAVTRFLGGLRRIDRVVEIRRLEMAPEETGLRVGLELGVYVDGTSGS